MASTITLQHTIETAKRFVYNAPLLFVNSGDLVYDMANEVRQFILAPPFAWRWNRSVSGPIVCAAGKSDYQMDIPDFGWLEKATITYPIVGNNNIQPPNTPTITKELTVRQVLSIESVLGEPAFISPVFDDNNGNITFRLMPVPDAPYTLNIIYQKAAPLFTSVNDTWAPIPDYMHYLYHDGFLAKVYEYKDDARFAFSEQEFVRQTVAVNGGLDDTQKNIFLAPYLTYQREIQASAQNGQISRQGRAS